MAGLGSAEPGIDIEFVARLADPPEQCVQGDRVAADVDFRRVGVQDREVGVEHDIPAGLDQIDA